MAKPNGLLMIDNYDSFTYNLVQYFGELKAKPIVFRNNEITVEKVKKLNPRQIVISPGPCTPLEAGVSNEIIRTFAGKVPILGVCLGHQCMGHTFGGKVIRAKQIMHGKTSEVYHNGKDLFKNLSNPFTATRYHSLLVEKKSFPKDLEITAWTKQNEVMGLRHKTLPVWGVQFHPESILTPSGKDILQNFLNLSEAFWKKKK